MVRPGTDTAHAGDTPSDDRATYEAAQSLPADNTGGPYENRTPRLIL
ncbi:MAG TPA: hypothetical protein VG272_01715 [Candidatus Acidoferrales bacterium]|nr:hypothetical protein [Candidatus Acidoferrales bacterium]